MSAQHRELSAGRWTKLAFFEQMANIGSEVERALGWRRKNSPGYAQRAFERALELLDLTLACRGTSTQLRELARVREALVDFFSGSNIYASTEASWSAYFSAFAYAARRQH